MIHLIINLVVKEESDIATVQELLTELGRSCRTEPGCERYEIYHSTSEANAFFIMEWWESQEALDQHREAAGYLEIYRPKVLPLVERIPHPSELLK